MESVLTKMLSNHSKILHDRADSLSRIEIEITRQHQQNMLNLETKYKSLIDDLIDEKTLIQQKLNQFFYNQINMLWKLKLTIPSQLLSKEQKQALPIEESVKQEQVIENNDIGTRNPIPTSDRNTYGYHNINHTHPNTVDIPLFVKNEDSPPIELCQNTLNVKNDASIETPKFDINETEERMKQEINNHITRIEKTQDSRKFQCKDCNKKFKRLYHAQNHFAMNHINEKPFKCNQCDKSFVLRRLLRKHEYFHSTKYQCTFCGKKCGQKEHLKNHERTHTGERPFKCQHDGCGKSFNRKCNLVKHQRTHTGEKPFECDIKFCHKKYTTAANLRKHKINVHLTMTVL